MAHIEMKPVSKIPKIAVNGKSLKLNLIPKPQWDIMTIFSIIARAHFRPTGTASPA
jgi:hypothetical protein